MPEISRFMGIVVRMYLFDHPPPHFHVIYGEWNARIRITPPGLLGGRLPPRVLARVLEWARLHETALRDNWRRLQAHVPPVKIAPLE